MFLRMELCLPFTVLHFTTAFWVALVFIAVNGHLEVRYARLGTIRDRFILLAKWLPWNVLVLAVGLAIETKWTYLSGGQVTIDYSKIWILVWLVLVLSGSLLAWRLITVIIDKVALRW